MHCVSQEAIGSSKDSVMIANDSGQDSARTEQQQQQALDVFISICGKVERGHQSAGMVILQSLQSLSCALLVFVRRHAQLITISAIKCASPWALSSSKPCMGLAPVRTVSHLICGP